MGKYGGWPGVYYYKTEKQAREVARLARRAGCNARVSRWLDRAPGVHMWEIVVTRSRRKKT